MTTDVRRPRFANGTLLAAAGAITLIAAGTATATAASSPSPSNAPTNAPVASNGTEPQIVGSSNGSATPGALPPGCHTATEAELKELQKATKVVVAEGTTSANGITVTAGESKVATKGAISAPVETSGNVTIKPGESLPANGTPIEVGTSGVVVIGGSKATATDAAGSVANAGSAASVNGEIKVTKSDGNVTIKPGESLPTNGTPIEVGTSGTVVVGQANSSTVVTNDKAPIASGVVAAAEVGTGVICTIDAPAPVPAPTKANAK